MCPGEKWTLTQRWESLGSGGDGNYGLQSKDIIRLSDDRHTGPVGGDVDGGVDGGVSSTLAK